MAATENTEKKNVTGLDLATDRKETEYDLVKSLLKAANYKEDEESITEVEIKRAGELLFTVHIHPISDPDIRAARKKATKYMPNPNGKKLPPIEREFDNAVFGSWVIYMATTEEDQAKIWGNPTIMQNFGLAQPVESIDVLLRVGEKRKLMELVTEISGLDDEDDEDFIDEEEYAKN